MNIGSFHLTRFAPLLLLILSLSLMPGCGGCTSSKPLTAEEREKMAEESEKKKEDQEKLDFEPPKISALPEDKRCSIKPGHWIEVRQELKSNNFDFVGEAACTAVTSKNVDLKLERSAFHVESSRPTALIKGQTKVIDLPVYITRPPTEDGETSSVRLRPALRGRNTARVFEFGAMPTTVLRPYQFHMAILSKTPDKYGFVRATSTVNPPTDDWSTSDAPRVNYIVSAPPLDDGVHIPHSAMTMTNMAYILWDDVDPDALSADQQTAVTDWLHWGGQLIVSGPGSIEQLRLGFLSEYLPVKPGQIVNVEQSRIDDIDEYWSLTPRKPRPEGLYKLADNKKPLQVIELELLPGANFVPNTSQLVAERAIGRGRIVVTAFGLGEQHMLNWRSFDGFFNSCLLRRPARKFTKGRDGIAIFAWQSILGRVQDPRLSTQLRYFTRDAAVEGLAQDSSGRALEFEPTAEVERNRISAGGELSKKQGGYAADPTTGIAAWNDFSSAAIASRNSLVDSAGVTVPNGKFVAKLLAMYLLFLVPVNWLIFRLAGRVEWAWFAAPLIAVLGAIAVIRLAQLDIGFVRSRTEIAIVETQGDYQRAHLTRYTGLYTSLSTGYDLEFEDSTALALPFSTDPSDAELRLASLQRVQFHQQKQAGLKGVPILSNSTGLLHSEQMIQLVGPIAMRTSEESSTIENGTDWTLHSTALVRRDGNTFQVSTLGDLDPGSISEAKSDSVTDEALDRFLDRSPITRQTTPKGEVSLRQLYRLAMDPRQLRDGQSRLVAWTDAELEGVTIDPNSNQCTSRVLIVCNLNSGTLPEPQPDKNLYEDVREKQDNLFDPIEK